MSKKRSRDASKSSNDVELQVNNTGSIKQLENVNIQNKNNLIPSICKPAPFSTDADAIIERTTCDYDTKITMDMANSSTAPRKIRVYADGIYDMFHQGHARQLMQAKTIFQNVYLIVGVCSDRITHARKGKTVMTDEERYEAVRHCRYVDEVLKDAPWEINDQFLINNKIDFVAHDDIPYINEEGEDVYQSLKDKGMFVGTQRTEGVSTSDVISRIVRDYDMYVRRNLKRGYSAKDLNVSYLREKRLKLQNKMEELKDRSKRVMGTIGEKRVDIIQRWEEKSRDFIVSFLLLFGRDGPISHFWNDSKGKLLQAFSPPASPTESGRSTPEFESSSSSEENSRSPPRKSIKNDHYLEDDCNDDDDDDVDNEEDLLERYDYINGSNTQS
ncbi:choline-phosphate cytidylyltransferase A-like isoform X2 [Daktulosphaira vitifoliae]|uniref:choline-phosphate cytidylyltransferase A-like isoform X2 n=1 Tax=Daktulosphaira vitifoliae TaxID=58002 RepID=UPI0021A9B5E6|nr:choline-phosphate cytidylyltransferase A-like isoform X2 [Daktulosphaira vitifoliae]